MVCIHRGGGGGGRAILTSMTDVSLLDYCSGFLLIEIRDKSIRETKIGLSLNPIFVPVSTPLYYNKEELKREQRSARTMH